MTERYASAIRRLESDRDALQARCVALTEALRRFVAIADHSTEAEAEAWGRARQMQEAASLARAGKQKEAIEIRDRLDSQPRVRDFSKTVATLADAAIAARAALKEHS